VGEGDKQLIDITTASADGAAGGDLSATGGHPFWTDEDGDTSTPGGRWVDAAELRQGR
jgi:hypothetical protein